MRFRTGLRTQISFFSLLLIWIILSSSHSYARSYWWEKKEEGWFFYKDPPKEEKKEEIKKEEPQKLQTPPTPSHPTLPPPLFTERMKKWGEELLSRAMEEPSIENVKAYMEYNRIMMKLSEDFSLAWQKALMMYPELESPVPVSDADKDLYLESRKVAEGEILRELAGKAGLFFFYDGSCSYCERQAYHLKRFMSEYPYFTVKPVSLDGSVFAEFPNTSMDNGISQRLGVTTVPSIFLAFPPDRFERIASGLVTASELKRRLIWYASEIDTNYHSRILGP